MNQYVDFLNLEYVLVRAYELIVAINVGGIPQGVLTFVQAIFVVGMFLSLLFLVLIVYFQIRLLQTEHAGFHAAEAHELPEPEVISTGKNDRWERIAELAASANESDWRRALLEADIMLGDALNAQGYAGATVGEQLKVVNPIQVTTLDLAWKAHKVRNDVAHGGEGYQLTERETRSAIEYYKRVFEELGAI